VTRSPVASAVTQATARISPTVLSMIPEGYARVLEVQAGQWGSAIGQVVLAERGGVEAKYAVFNSEVLKQFQDACKDQMLITPAYQRPKKGSKVYLTGLRREESVL
jgi:hypothetical protein